MLVSTVLDQPPRPTPAKQHRFHQLDGLRGLAALLIIFWHLPPVLISRAWENTYLAVDFFFCLSGFVIAFSYERRLLEGFRFKAFLSARVIRLYPTFLLGMFLGLILYLPARFDLILQTWKEFRRSPHYNF